MTSAWGQLYNAEQQSASNLDLNTSPFSYCSSFHPDLIINTATPWKNTVAFLKHKSVPKCAYFKVFLSILIFFSPALVIASVA